MYQVGIRAGEYNQSAYRAAVLLKTKVGPQSICLGRGSIFNNFVASVGKHIAGIWPEWKGTGGDLDDLIHKIPMSRKDSSNCLRDLIPA
jgi:hypothetical protein